MHAYIHMLMMVQTFAELAVSAARFREENRIGCGSYSPVFLSEFDTASLAVKVSEDPRSQREIEILSTGEHPTSLVFLAGLFRLGHSNYMVLELVQYDLDNKLKNHLLGSWFFPCSERAAALRDVAAALRFLHSHTPCICRRDLDLKSTNILSAEGQAREARGLWHCVVW